MIRIGSSQGRYASAVQTGNIDIGHCREEKLVSRASLRREELYLGSDMMIGETEVLPVTSGEAVSILGSLNMEELQRLLEDIRISRSHDLLTRRKVAALDPWGADRGRKGTRSHELPLLVR